MKRKKYYNKIKLPWGSPVMFGSIQEGSNVSLPSPRYVDYKHSCNRGKNIAGEKIKKCTSSDSNKIVYKTTEAHFTAILSNCKASWFYHLHILQ